MRFIYNKHKQTNHRNTPFLNYRIFLSYTFTESFV